MASTSGIDKVAAEVQDLRRKIEAKEAEIEAKEAEIKEQQLQATKAEPALRLVLERQVAAMERQVAAKEEQVAALQEEVLVLRQKGQRLDMQHSADPYIFKLMQLPSPHRLAQAWPDFESTFNFLRPDTAPGTAAALAHPLFGMFLDLASSVELDDSTCQVTLELAVAMSKTYMDDTTSGSHDVGDADTERRAGKERAHELRALLRKLFKVEACAPPCLEPSTDVLGSTPDTDGSWRVKAGGTVMSHILIIEVKEDVGLGGANPMVQLAGDYAKLLASKAHLPVVQHSCYPALGLEVVGNMLRVHALYYTDCVNCQPLTPMLHLSDLRLVAPGYTESLARVFKALTLTLVGLEMLYQEQPGDVPAARIKHLRQGVPYVLQDYDDVQQLRGGLVYLCKPKSKKRKPFIAKLIPSSSYPTKLHKEAASLNLVPALIGKPKRQPGGFTLIKTRYLDPAAGWKVLSDYDGDFEAVATAARNALKRWQTKLSRAAVHGDMRTPNIYVRDTNDGVEVRFIHLDWAGEEGVAKYPPFINLRVDWGLPKLAGQPILQQHDVNMLEKSLDALQAWRRPSPRCAGTQPGDARMQA